MDISPEDMTEIILYVPSSDMTKIYAKSGKLDISVNDLILQLVMDGINNME